MLPILLVCPSSLTTYFHWTKLTGQLQALETRIAIYGYAVCSAVLGFFTWFSTGVRKDISNEEDETEYAAKVVKHIKDVDQSVMTLMLTGIALIVTSVIHQRAFHAFGLFHAYIVLLLLWVISLTGMWFIIHSWASVFNSSGSRANQL